MKQVYINTLDIPSIQRFAVGFDRMFDELSRTAGTLNASNYPPYNIIKESETIWKIEVAVAGFDESELDVEIVNNELVVTGAVNK
jgi:molecular chaperone IbpA